MTKPAARKLSVPEIAPETAPFWEAAKAGTLLVKRCRACGEAHYYPRAVCPFCRSSDTVWEEARGTGTIYALSVLRRGADAPLALAYVVLEEGPAVLTNIVDADLDTLTIGQAVRVRFTPTEGGPPVPTFAPATS